MPILPSDIHGAVGPTHIITATNTEIEVYDKGSCFPFATNLITKNSLNAMFNAGTGEVYSDPQVLWDDTNQRFIITAHSIFSSSNDQNQGILVSTYSDGMSWYLYTVPIVRGSSTFANCVASATDHWDSPHVGSINGAYPLWFVTANVIPNNGTSPTGTIMAIRKPLTLSGEATGVFCYPNLSQINIAPPNVLDSSDTAYFLTLTSGSGNVIVVLARSENNGLALFNFVAIPTWTAPPPAAQPNGVTLDTGDGRFVSQTIQYGTSLWNVHSVNVGNRAVGRLYQISTTGQNPLLTKDLFTADNDNIFNLSVAVNATQAFVSASRTIPSDPTLNGNASMVVFSGPNSSPVGWGARFVARSAAQYDGSICTRPCGWGHYSSVQIDPSNHRFAWLFNQLITGPSAWNTLAVQDIGVSAGCIVAVQTHDFNGDCKSDIVWRQDTGATAVWLMNGAQVLQSGGFGVVPTNWQLVGQRDFNGDGMHDWLWRDTSSGTVAIWLLNGLSIIQSGTVGTVPGDWSIVGTGDFNGDGMADILWRDTSGNLGIWLMNGLGVLQIGNLGQVPTSWTVVGVADFNGDGMADILWRDTSGNLAIWLMNGLGVLQIGNLGQVPTSWTVVGVADFNGDGMADILWRDSAGNVGIWLMNGLQVLQINFVPQIGNLGQVPLNWIVAATGDFNGYGKSDILWRDANTGTVAIWFMNGLQVSSTANLGAVGLDWTIQGLNAD
jgi:hypothetical protein